MPELTRTLAKTIAEFVEFERSLEDYSPRCKFPERKMDVLSKGEQIDHLFELEESRNLFWEIDGKYRLLAEEICDFLTSPDSAIFRENRERRDEIFNPH